MARTTFNVSLLVMAGLLVTGPANAEPALEAPFCTLLKASIKAASAETSAKAEQTHWSLPGAGFCAIFKNGYYCLWQGMSEKDARALQVEKAKAAEGCLTGYTKSEESLSTGPNTKFRSGNIEISVGTGANVQGAIDAVAVVVKTER